MMQVHGGPWEERKSAFFFLSPASLRYEEASTEDRDTKRWHKHSSRGKICTFVDFCVERGFCGNPLSRSKV